MKYINDVLAAQWRSEYHRCWRQTVIPEAMCATMRRSVPQKIFPTASSTFLSDTRPRMNEFRKIVEYCTSYPCICFAAGAKNCHLTNPVHTSTRE